MSEHFESYRCARGEHEACAGIAWVPDIPCECQHHHPRCTIPYPHGTHTIDDGRLQVACPGVGGNA